MKTSKKILLGLAGLLIVGGGAGWYFWPKADPVAKYRTQAVSKGELVQTVSATGTLNPVLVVSVGTQVSGTVRKLNVDFNDKVTEGQILLELDTDQLKASLRQSQATLTSSRAKLKYTTAQAERMRTLFTQNYVSKQELDSAESDLAAAKAAVVQGEAQVERDTVNMNNAIIRSPVSGIVIDKQVDLGQTVAASYQTPTLLKIAQDLSKMQIHANFAEADLARIKPELPTTFRVDAFPDMTLPGKVNQVRLNPTTNSNVVTYDVVIDVDNPRQRLLPGMTAYVDVEIGRRDNAIMVPNAALRYRPPGVAAEKSGKGGRDASGAAAWQRRGDEASRPRNASGAADASGAANASAPQSRGFGNGGGGMRMGGRQRGTVYVLQADGQLKAISVRLGITDGKFTEILPGRDETELPVKEGQMLVIGETQPDGAQPATGGNRQQGQGGPGQMPRRF
ncbi:HlyD family secretion protein [Andreprevotia lacus DSM 23236]|jgi:HlyD family secretion protein|uniref:HlyD family secretion protein n=1 Tax=Andreprevotia lacus DSM 23236 TaxID=1121001 RepID=A0A1W1X9J8_9NEIS|nr:efflux RND transporter periplasmic adaptor subunit [Andreprevotia lacus]SMC20596.1 HlyD family secretion protein [Andreprevotia lacus DSM 23236]